VENPEQNTPPADGTGDDKGSKKVVFTDEQQVKLQELIDGAYAKGASQVEKKLTKAEQTIADLQKEIEALKAAPKADDKGGKDGKAKDKDGQTPPGADDDSDGRTRLGRLQAQFDELRNNFDVMKKERDTLKGEIDGARARDRRTNFERTFEDTAKDFNFFKTSTVLREVEDVLQHEDDGSITVLNPKTKQPRLNTEMQPFALKDLLAEYASQNPHMVKTEVAGGSGAQESQKQVTDSGKPKSIKDMTVDEIKALENRVMAGEHIPLK
jgi:hypothetical protein